MTFLLYAIAAFLGIYFILKYRFDISLFDVFLDLKGLGKGKKTEVRENLMVLRNTIEKRHSLTPLEVNQVQNVLNHHNPLRHLPKSDAAQVAEVLKCLPENVAALESAKVQQALSCLDRALDRYL